MTEERGRRYAVKEIFYTLQGEGAQAGRAAVFLRFAGCNLWSGREADRASAACDFWDTEFVGTDGAGGGRFGSANALAAAVRQAWSAPWPARGRPLVVCTGGEPLLQLDAAATRALHRMGFDIAVETNGTQPRPSGIDWLCVSPKGNQPLEIRGGDELKLVYPQPGVDPARFLELSFGRFSLQPMDGPNRVANTEATLAYIRAHPTWRLSVQQHKDLGIP